MLQDAGRKVAKLRMGEAPVTLRNLTMLDWARMSDEMARRECDGLARSLPQGLKFDGLEAHAYCGREHRIARFSRREPGKGADFVLVPGGQVSLGFDGHDFKPTVQQIESFVRFVEADGIDRSIREFVDAQTSARREVLVPPMLIEIDARAPEKRDDVEAIGADDPLFHQFGDGLEDRATAEFSGGVLGAYSYIAERDADGTCRVWRRPPTTLQYVEICLARTGMRLLTCDEWEHACGAGAPALFRWGNDTPADFYPDDASAEDRRRKQAWALSGGTLAYARPPTVWDLHERPNLFGLRIARNPYGLDLVSDGPRALGGDGGCNICGGAGFFLGWLPLATSFRDSNRGGWFVPDKNVADDYCRVRRVIPLDG